MLEGKHILITGGAGFIGTRLAGRLVERNRVTVLDLMRRDALSGTPLAAHPNLTLIKGDVRDAELVAGAMREATHVVHLASIAGVDTVMNNPLLTMDVTIKGTFNVLEQACEAPALERVIDFSTSEVFGSYAFRASERDVTSLGAVGEARWTYAVSKLATEHLCHVMHRQKDLPAVTVRPFNIFGPGQVGEGAIHHFIVRALSGQELVVHNDGAQIRAWCYVDDMIDGLMLTLTRPRGGGAHLQHRQPAHGAYGPQPGGAHRAHGGLDLEDPARGVVLPGRGAPDPGHLERPGAARLRAANGSGGGARADDRMVQGRS